MTMIEMPVRPVVCRGSAATPPRPPTHVEAAAQRLLDPAVNRLFRVTLDLASIAASTERDTSNRLLETVASVDETIRQLRNDLIDEVARLGHAPSTTGLEVPSSQEWKWT